MQRNCCLIWPTQQLAIESMYVDLGTYIRSYKNWHFEQNHLFFYLCVCGVFVVVGICVALVTRRRANLPSMAITSFPPTTLLDCHFVLNL